MFYPWDLFLWPQYAERHTGYIILYGKINSKAEESDLSKF
jgi:hypothetical protein